MHGEFAVESIARLQRLGSLWPAIANLPRQALMWQGITTWPTFSAGVLGGYLLLCLAIKLRDPGAAGIAGFGALPTGMMPALTGCKNSSARRQKSCYNYSVLLLRWFSFLLIPSNTNVWKCCAESKSYF